MKNDPEEIVINDRRYRVGTFCIAKSSGNLSITHAAFSLSIWQIDRIYVSENPCDLDMGDFHNAHAFVGNDEGVIDSIIIHSSLRDWNPISYIDLLHSRARFDDFLRRIARADLGEVQREH